MDSKTIQLKPVQSERLSPSEYLKMRDTDKSNIEQVRIIPPKLGTRDFGGLSVTYKTPVWKQA